jgi:hypothetical protein
MLAIVQGEAHIGLNTYAVSAHTVEKQAQQGAKPYEAGEDWENPV